MRTQRHFSSTSSSQDLFFLKKSYRQVEIKSIVKRLVPYVGTQRNQKKIKMSTLVNFHSGQATHTRCDAMRYHVQEKSSTDKLCLDIAERRVGQLPPSTGWTPITLRMWVHCTFRSRMSLRLIRSIRIQGR